MIKVSTHAPARGATQDGSDPVSEGWVSTHAPARGATDADTRTESKAPGFNPRTRTGCDMPDKYRERTSTVSTHAPARGATFFSSHSLFLSTRFNPRTRTGCDL